MVLFLIGFQKVSGNEVGLKDMCPALPKEIASQEPRLEDFVSTTPTDKEWNHQFNEYNQAIENFKSKYSSELKKVKTEWKLLEDNQSPSQKRFYSMITDDENDELLKEVKSACWKQVMGINELEKHNFCNPLEKPPTSKDWHGILLCTTERTKLLNIKLL